MSIEKNIADLIKALDKEKKELEEALAICERRRLLITELRDGGPPPKTSRQTNMDLMIKNARPVKKKKRKKPRPKPTTLPDNLEKTSVPVGKKVLKQGSNAAVCVEALRSKPFHFITVDGIAELIRLHKLKGSGPLPAGILPIIHAEMKALREGKYRVSNLKYRRIDRRFEYMISEDIKELKK